MPSQPSSRRHFLAQTSLAAASTLGFPAITSARSPNSRLNLVFIGVGGRGAANIQGLVGVPVMRPKNAKAGEASAPMPVPSENVIAICDVNGENLDRAADAQPNERAAIELFERERHTHPHNSPLGVMVSSGVPAGLLLLAVTIASGVAAWRRGASDASGPDVVRAYAAGPGWIILAMTLLWPFDVVTQSVQPAAMLMLGIALAPGWLPWRPGDAPTPPGSGG
jgi:hypothetical protein